MCINSYEKMHLKYSLIWLKLYVCKFCVGLNETKFFSNSLERIFVTKIWCYILLFQRRSINFLVSTPRLQFYVQILQVKQWTSYFITLFNFSSDLNFSLCKMVCWYLIRIIDCPKNWQTIEFSSLQSPTMCFRFYDLQNEANAYVFF